MIYILKEIYEYKKACVVHKKKKLCLESLELLFYKKKIPKVDYQGN